MMLCYVVGCDVMQCGLQDIKITEVQFDHIYILLDNIKLGQ